jgi:carbon storage regulator
MLILTRTPSQKIIMGDQGEVELTVLSIRGKQVKLGIKAHEAISVHREEIFDQIKSEDKRKKA